LDETKVQFLDEQLARKLLFNLIEQALDFGEI
jgi:hypothetical protein